MYSSRKEYTITTCASVNATETLWISKNRTDSVSDGIDGGTGCNFIFFTLFADNDLIKSCHKYILLFLNLEIQSFINLDVKNAKNLNELT